ncbi:MAG: 2-dehydro-3-deoxy-6-phosphogalactonate aldolase [Victivallaceae bacterium]|nr:2-dehydro-3-deoxy-6-phosphogalactonate aldolase [Victivallaceae bacterium]
MKELNAFEVCCAQAPVIAILRGITPDEIGSVTDALYRGGVLLLEIPLNSPDALTSISRAAKHCAGRQMVGAGTVLTSEDVRAVAQAGGKFIISPNTDVEVIEETVRQGLISMPGFATASEGFTAIKAGADYLKLFPAGQFGPGYIKDLQAVIKKPICAVGGVNSENIPAFMKVCAGVGIGSALYKPGVTPEEIEVRAREMVAKSLIR